MANLNKITVIGNLGTDPEMRYTSNGIAVTSFRMATNRVYNTSEGERKEETEWFTIVAWNRLAEHCNQFLTKGRQAYVEGRLRSATWQTPDGQTRSRNEIVASQVLFLDRGPASAGGGSSPEEPSPDPMPDTNTQVDADELPF